MKFEQNGIPIINQYSIRIHSIRVQCDILALSFQFIIILHTLNSKLNDGRVKILKKIIFLQSLQRIKINNVVLMHSLYCPMSGVKPSAVLIQYIFFLSINITIGTDSNLFTTYFIGCFKLKFTSLITISTAFVCTDFYKFLFA